MSTVPEILKYINSNNFSVIDQNIEMPVRAKKRRLDHLTWEEKLQRKKLKNRVAAQVSRDRKKMKMEQMESNLQEVFDKNETLLSECEALRKQNEKLSGENAELMKRLQAPCSKCNQEPSSKHQNRSGEREAVSGTTVSQLLRPKGTATRSAAILAAHQEEVRVCLLKMLLACLLYRTCSTNSTTKSISPLLNSSHKAFCKISPETWKLLLRKQIVKNQNKLDKIYLEKWWGRHQNSWNPVEVK